MVRPARWAIFGAVNFECAVTRGRPGPCAPPPYPPPQGGRECSVPSPLVGEGRVGGIRLTLGLLLVLLHNAASLGAGPGDLIDIGAARVDITPSYPVRLSGYLNRNAESSGVAQR